MLVYCLLMRLLAHARPRVIYLPFPVIISVIYSRIVVEVDRCLGTTDWLGCEYNAFMIIRGPFYLLPLYECLIFKKGHHRANNFFLIKESRISVF